jgi:hypothetical protein
MRDVQVRQLKLTIAMIFDRKYATVRPSGSPPFLLPSIAKPQACCVDIGLEP